MFLLNKILFCGMITCKKIIKEQELGLHEPAENYYETILVLNNKWAKRLY